MAVSSDEFHIEPHGAHDRAVFSCGVEPLDCYLKQQAGKDGRKKVAVTFLLLTSQKRIAGYHTLSSAALKGDDLPFELIEKLKPPRSPVLPATLIGRLAVDTSFRGLGLGELLLVDALKRAWTTSFQVASMGVIVDAKDELAIAFYRKYGFLSFPENRNRLFLPMGTIAPMFEKRR